MYVNECIGHISIIHTISLGFIFHSEMTSNSGPHARNVDDSDFFDRT